MKISSLEVLFTPADFGSLCHIDLSKTVCVVFDVLRATSSMITALGNGAAAIVPVEDIESALAVRKREPDVLLAGERAGVRIEAELTGSISFDLGNSPREFRKERVYAKTIVMTTTNGTRALRACAQAQRVLVCSFLNLSATARSIAAMTKPFDLMLVCGGTYEQSAYEDALCAGALSDLLHSSCIIESESDSSLMARKLYRQEGHDILAAISQARNGRRLLSLELLRDDVKFCAQRDSVDLVADMHRDGRIRKSDAAGSDSSALETALKLPG